MKPIAAAVALALAAALVAPSAEAAQRCWFQFKGDAAPSETSVAVVGAANCQPKPEKPARVRKLRLPAPAATSTLAAKLAIVR